MHTLYTYHDGPTWIFLGGGGGVVTVQKGFGAQYNCIFQYFQMYMHAN